MINARKAYGDRVILDNVTLNFLPGAKIGVVGPNGMGKSTLLKIMAGLETVSNGEAYVTPGYLGRHPAAGAAAGRDENRRREHQDGLRRHLRQGHALQQDRRGDGQSRMPISMR
jgi:ATPase subunit of ABC transporter with duplicated ATPase domains